MIIKLLQHTIKAIAPTFVCAAVLIAAPRASAMDTGVYADTSALSTGRWVRVSVPTTGMYRLTASTLRRWGFSDPSKVRVYGYGGTRITDVLSVSNYVDDLPMAPQEVMDDGSVVFFGLGPENWVSTTVNRFVNRSNIYTTEGYYFVSETGAAAPEFAETGRTSTIVPTEVFFERVQHEVDRVSPGEAGEHLVGEDLRSTPKRTFKFNLPGRVADGIVWMEVSAVVNCSGGTSQLKYTANGAAVEAASGDVVSAKPNNSHIHGIESVSRRTLTVSGNTLDLGLTFSSSGMVSGAWLDFIALNYERQLSLSGTDGWLLFNSNKQTLKISSITDDTRIWDMTNIHQPRKVCAGVTDGASTWTANYSGWRRYVAWNSDAKMPEPTFVENVSNQNMHADGCVDMVIFSPTAWTAQSERIADMHRAEGMTVRVVDPQKVYNEFSSGMADISGLRRYLKMLYDRGAGSEHPLQYVLLMGRATYDNRHLTSSMANAAPTLPCWMGGTLRNSLNDEEGFGTDDFLAMLADGTGANLGSDKLSVAVGRLPVTSATQAANYVDKLEQYVLRPKMKSWKNQMLVLADDQDGGVHMSQTEGMLSGLDDKGANSYIVNKVYIDDFTKSGGEYPLARELMFRYLNEGMVWWTFVGHANNHSMTGDGQLTYNDINNMFLKTPPVLFAATCDFLRWDSATESGGEILHNERYGGTIATISATRPVYIYENGLFVNAMGRSMGARDENGRYYRLGHVYRNAKNDIRDKNGNFVTSTNRLRFVLMGDPAMRMPNPDNRVVLDSIAGIPVGSDEQAVIPARGSAVFSGRVTTPDGATMTGFNGYVNATIYDSDFSSVTNGNGDDGVEFAYDQHGTRVFAGSAPVTAGRFSLKAVIPYEIADNYRNCTISMYALSNDATLDADSTAMASTAVNGRHEAMGVCRDFYLYGFDEDAEADTVAPVIERFYLNHENFKDGDKVNTSPMAIAEIRDDIGLNLSSAGVGHSMTLILDGNKIYDDVAQYFIPSSDGTPSGSINYPLENLRPGEHTLMLRVWDSNLNSRSSTISFTAADDVAPQIIDIYSDANPASTQANFYLRHNRPDAMVTVTVTVYNMMGHALWSQSQTGLSDMFLTTPVTWNLTDAAGRRVGRGIYLYRATMTCDDNTYDSGVRRIAVTN